ncbi:cell division protein ZapA [Salisaeta longa]|uniref:cell division protein ZapA n=1 Tax=Salisaeta longa TaxID=503170 RepID=UPI0003B53A4A|nr:cell division protein ZapA [Salisaeta longa]
MSEDAASKSVRVQILGREYALRVSAEDEEHTHRVARVVHERMKAFRAAHPEQDELTTAVITALGLADELHTVNEQRDQEAEQAAAALHKLTEQLAEAVADAALPEPEEAVPSSTADA